jgi:hypothetical protein
VRASLVALAAAALAGCASRSGPAVAPAPEPGHVAIVARAAERTGAVQAISIAITNGREHPVQLDARQAFAVPTTGGRVAPLPPAEAARLAGGLRVPGAVRGGVVGAATGGAFGALGGVISGAIQGGIGTAAAVGSAVGAAIGAITGTISGARGPQPDVSGFTERALPSTSLAPESSATGYVYYPAGTYGSLEVLLRDERSDVVLRETVPVVPAE